MSSSTTLTPPILRRHTAPDMDKITKRSPPRNTKAWTLEDERALLQGRLERIPYKQIGARIGKTDLACRLHFHQMVMAKRTPQTAPGRSIVFLSSEHPPEVHRLAPIDQHLITSPALSAVCEHETSPKNDNTYRDPRLYGEPTHRRSYSSSHLDHDRFTGWQPVASPYTNPQITEQTSSKVDIGRLNTIYKQHANDFWSTIATKYSGGEALSPSRLEQAFLHHTHTIDETTPEIPRIILTTSEPSTTPLLSHRSTHDTILEHGPRHSRSVSDATIAGRCSVESLLNQ